MKKLMIFIFVFLSCLLINSYFAGGISLLVGKIVSIDAKNSSFTIKTADKKDYLLITDKNCVLLRNGKTLKHLTELKKGELVVCVPYKIKSPQKIIVNFVQDEASFRKANPGYEATLKLPDKTNQPTEPPPTPSETPSPTLTPTTTPTNNYNDFVKLIYTEGTAIVKKIDLEKKTLIIKNTNSPEITVTTTAYTPIIDLSTGKLATIFDIKVGDKVQLAGFFNPKLNAFVDVKNLLFLPSGKEIHPSFLKK